MQTGKYKGKFKSKKNIGARFFQPFKKKGKGK